MNEKTLAIIVKANDQASKVLDDIGGSVTGFAKKIASHALDIAKYTATAAAAIVGLGVKSAAEFQQTRIGLENMLGSADSARSLLKDISKFAADTPFEFPELAQATRQLVAFGFTGKDAFNTMKQLGDVSAAVGAPINDLAYLMGTLKTQGRAFTVDIRQFAQRGIPIYEYLAKVLKKNTQQITSMIEEGKIGFPEVQKAFAAMTAEGGKFHGTMEKQSRSLSGLFSTLQDNIGQTLREFVGITQEGDIKEGSIFDRLAQALTYITANMPTMIAQMKEFISGITPQLIAWGMSFWTVAQQVITYLTPSLLNLLTVVKDKLLPALFELWTSVLAPIAQVIGVALVEALKLAMDYMSWWFSFISNNTWIIVALGAALVAVKTALLIAQAVQAFQAGMAGVQAAAATASAVINSTIISSILGITSAAAGALAMVGALTIAITSLNAKSALDKKKAEIAAQLNAVKAAHPEKAKEIDSKLREMGYAEGGFTGRGPANEVAGIVHKGEYVIPKSQVNQDTGLPNNMGGTFNMYGNVNLGSAGAVDRFFERINSQKEMSSYGVGV